MQCSKSAYILAYIFQPFFRPVLSNEFLWKWVKLKTGLSFTFENRLLSNNALVSFAIMERLKLRFSGSFYNMQKMSKGDYMEMDCTLCNAQPKSLKRSPAVGDFYGTGIEIWAGFGLNGQLSCLHSFKIF